MYFNLIEEIEIFLYHGDPRSFHLFLEGFLTSVW